MKKVILTLCMVAMIAVAETQAQTATLKIGYTSADAILGALPEAKKIETDLKAFQGQLVGEGQKMQEELKKKYADYQANADKWAPSIRETKEKELQTMQQSLQEYEQKVGQDIEKKRSELLQPVYNKIQGGIDEIAKAEGFTFILSSDASGFPILLFAGEVARKELDITNKVIIKLGGTPLKEATEKPAVDKPAAEKPAVDNKPKTEPKGKTGN